MKKFAIYKFEDVDLKDYYFSIHKKNYNFFFIKRHSAICTVFNAAPFNKLSDTTHKLIALLLELSFLNLDINVK